jgi:hypothetical protein
MKNLGFAAIIACLATSFAGCTGTEENAIEETTATTSEALVRALTFDDVPSGTIIDTRYTGVTFTEPLYKGHVYAVEGLSGNGNVISIHDPNDPKWGSIASSNFAAEEGAVDATFTTLQTTVSIDAQLIEAIEAVGRIDRKPYLQAFNAAGSMIAQVNYPDIKPIGWRTLTISRASAEIKRIRFSSQNNWAGLTGCPSATGCPTRMYTGHYAEFDNLRFEDGTAATSGYVGCYQDDPGRALPVQLIAMHATITDCINTARSKGFAYAGLQAGDQCFAGNQLGLVKLADSACSTPCTADTTQKCGGDWVNSIYATGVSPVPGPSGKYLGCYVDSSTRALPIQIYDGDGTVESCVAAAQLRGLKYAGLQWYGQCFGGNTAPSTIATAAECNTPCTSNPNETCGGSYRNSVYDTGATPPPAVPATAYKGCWTDDWARALPVMLIGSAATVESCVAAAKSAGYTYAGLQDGGGCQAGNALGYTQVADSECSSRCIANSNEYCGAPFRNSIWTTK